MQLIVGAKETSFPGWASTDLRSPGARLDIRRAEDWARSFPPDSIDRCVAEHVLEHMTPDDAQAALCNIARHLRPGGRVRVAVPDAFNPDPVYQEHCRPGGKGQAWARLLFYAPDEPEHKTHFNYKTLSELMQRAGLTPQLLEWHDEQGRFNRRPWRPEDGPVRRYYNSPYNLQVYLPWHGFQNLSLIIDGVKEGGAGASAGGVCEVTLDARRAVAGAQPVRDSTGALICTGLLAAGVVWWISRK